MRIQTILTLLSNESTVCFYVTILSDERPVPELPELFSIPLFPGDAGIMTDRATINVTIVDVIIGKWLTTVT